MLCGNTLTYEEDGKSSNILLPEGFDDHDALNFVIDSAKTVEHNYKNINIPTKQTKVNKRRFNSESFMLDRFDMRRRMNES